MHNWLLNDGPFVLTTIILKVISEMADRDQPGLRRSEPSSRTPLIGEQPNPWNHLQFRDGTSRHRGAKLLRQ